jgi:hypothetical protein
MPSYATAPVIVGKARNFHVGRPALSIWCSQIDAILGSGTCAKASPSQLRSLYEQGIDSGRAAAMLLQPATAKLATGSPMLVSGRPYELVGQLPVPAPAPPSAQLPVPAPAPPPAPPSAQLPVPAPAPPSAGVTVSYPVYGPLPIPRSGGGGGGGGGPIPLAPALLRAGAALVSALQTYGGGGGSACSNFYDLMAPVLSFQAAWNAAPLTWSAPALVQNGQFDAPTASALASVTGRGFQPCVGGPPAPSPTPAPIRWQPPLGAVQHAQHAQLAGAALLADSTSSIPNPMRPQCQIVFHCTTDARGVQHCTSEEQCP